MNKKEKELRKNAQITDITEVIENEMGRSVRECVVSGYKWEIKTNLDNKPSHVMFFNEDYTDVLSVHLPPLFDRCLKEYKVHLEVEKKKVEEEKLEEKRLEDEELLDEKLDELIENYESFMIFLVKHELNERRTNEDNEYYEEDWKFNLTDIRCIVDYCFKDGRGIHLGIGSNKENSFSIREDWYLKNYYNLTQIILSLCPDYKPPSSPVSENEHGYKFMKLRNQNRNGEVNWDTQTMYGFYDKLIDLHRKMKKEKIGYWKS